MSATKRVEALKHHITAAPATGVASAGAGSGSASRSGFRYTAEPEPGSPPVLNDEQRAFYEENGYLVVRGLVDHAELDAYRRRFQDLCDGKVERSGIMTLMRDVALAKGKAKAVGDGSGEANITKVQHFEDDDVLFKFCQNPDVLRYVSAIVGPDVRSMHTMLINKAPLVGAPTSTSRHPIHQDAFYFPFAPADRVCCAWTAMERVDRTNGCLVVIPGTHRLALKPHGYPDWGEGVNKAYHGIQEDIEEFVERRQHLVMEKGDTVFFHPLLLHGSGANRSKRFRKAISCHYASTKVFFIDVRGTIQQSIADEVAEMAAKKGIADLDYITLWKAKSRLVLGDDGAEFETA